MKTAALRLSRTHVVFGTGVADAEVMFIGEGPGEQEDLTGEPFVGRGGQLLDKMLQVIDLDRKKNIYIANMVKCRPLRTETQCRKRWSGVSDIFASR